MDELLGEFITETKESLDALDVEIVKLEQDPSDKNLLSSIFRVMHTIKGTCGFLGLDILANLAHAAENVLGNIRDDKISPSPDVISVILIAIDRIKEIVARIEATGSEGDFNNKEIINKLNATIDICDQKEEINIIEEDISFPDFNQEEIKPQEIISQRIETIPQITEEAKKEAINHALNLETPAVSNKTNVPAKTATQTVRVNIDLLEDLMQLVSELVLNRNQLMQIMRNIHNRDNPFSIPLQRLSNITSELQDCAMKTRMHQIGSAWTQLPRIIRDLSVDLGKKIDLKVE
jgi:two-component system chemotaxis sensor kinase CheA